MLRKRLRRKVVYILYPYNGTSVDVTKTFKDVKYRLFGWSMLVTSMGV